MLDIQEIRMQVDHEYSKKVKRGSSNRSGANKGGTKSSSRTATKQERDESLLWSCWNQYGIEELFLLVVLEPIGGRGGGWGLTKSRKINIGKRRREYVSQRNIDKRY